MSGLVELLNEAPFAIAGQPTTWAEILGFVFGAAAVWLAAVRSVANFGVGMLNNVCWLVLFADAALYADAGLQIAYLGLSAAGWWAWLRGGPRRSELRVRRASLPLLAGTAVGVVALTAALVPIIEAAHGAAPLRDALTTAMSLGAMLLLAAKVLENWYVWIAVDLIYIPLYLDRGLYLTAVVYAIFLLICVRAAFGSARARAAAPRGDASGRGGGMSHGIVVGRFCPPHAGHDLVIEAALSGCERVTVVLLGRSDEPIPVALRHAWLEELHPGARVVSGVCDLPPDYDDPDCLARHEAAIVAAVGEPFDTVVSSERYGAELARRRGCRHLMVDRERRAVPVSATAVRADPAAHWAYLRAPVRAYLTRRVAVVGAESTGTTTLARALAAHYGTEWVPEHGRAVSEERLAAGTFGLWSDADFLAIARRQQADEDAAARRAGPVLVCDTDALATCIWQERYRGRSTRGVEAVAAARAYDLYILTGDDVPFAQDGVRDGEHLRAWMTRRFRARLAARPEPVLEVSGPQKRRLAAAIAAIDARLGVRAAAAAAS